MRFSTLTALAVALNGQASLAQDVVEAKEFIDPVTGIKFMNAKVERMEFGVALPSKEMNLDFIGRLAGREMGWGGIALGPSMVNHALIAGMPDIGMTEGVLLFTQRKMMPPPMLVPGVEIWPIHNYADRASWTYTFLCKNCLRFAAFNQSMDEWPIGFAWDKMQATVNKKHTSSAVVTVKNVLQGRDDRYDQWAAKASRGKGDYLGLPPEGNVPADVPQQTMPPKGPPPTLTAQKRAVDDVEIPQPPPSPTALPAVSPNPQRAAGQIHPSPIPAPPPYAAASPVPTVSGPIRPKQVSGPGSWPKAPSIIPIQPVTFAPDTSVPVLATPAPPPDVPTVVPPPVPTPSAAPAGPPAGGWNPNAPRYNPGPGDPIVDTITSPSSTGAAPNPPPLPSASPSDIPGTDPFNPSLPASDGGSFDNSQPLGAPPPNVNPSQGYNPPPSPPPPPGQNGGIYVPPNQGPPPNAPQTWIPPPAAQTWVPPSARPTPAPAPPAPRPQAPPSYQPQQQQPPMYPPPGPPSLSPQLQSGLYPQAQPVPWNQQPSYTPQPAPWNAPQPGAFPSGPIPDADDDNEPRGPTPNDDGTIGFPPAPAFPNGGPGYSAGGLPSGFRGTGAGGPAPAPIPYRPQPAPYQPRPAPYQPAPYQPSPYQPAPYQPAPYQPSPYQGGAPGGGLYPGGPINAGGFPPTAGGYNGGQAIAGGNYNEGDGD